ncbi:N-acetylglucosamine kinase [Luethyella okanaganae]|uniref:N-acetylglucosamine kinase n=1 Tax=Luethyella okanaganae TaxID=69372 RepID=A0ABW1VFE2_9MICO
MISTVVGDIGKSKIRLAVLSDGALSRTVEIESPVALGQPANSPILFGVVADALSQLRLEAPIDLGLGLAGMATTTASGASLVEAIRGVVNVNRIVIASDVVVAHLGAFAGDEGTVLIAGTGAAALNVEADSVPVLRDGHGPYFGDDGSGGWLGARAVRAVVKAAEGRGPATSLTKLLRVRTSLDPQTMVRRGNAADNPARWSGQFAPDVLRAWTTGDQVATGIVRDAVTALTTTVLSARRQSQAIALTGGLLRCEPFAQDLIRSITSATPEAIVTVTEGRWMQGANVLLELERTRIAGSLQSLTEIHVIAGG